MLPSLSCFHRFEKCFLLFTKHTIPLAHIDQAPSCEAINWVAFKLEYRRTTRNPPHTFRLRTHQLPCVRPETGQQPSCCSLESGHSSGRYCNQIDFAPEASLRSNATPRRLTEGSTPPRANSFLAISGRVSGHFPNDYLNMKLTDTLAYTKSILRIPVINTSRCAWSISSKIKVIWPLITSIKVLGITYRYQNSHRSLLRKIV